MKRKLLLVFFFLVVIIAVVSFFYINSQLELNLSDFSRNSSKINFQVFHLPTIGETNSGRITSADINKDGVLDIIVGFQWFEAPEWTRHQYALKEKDTMIDAGGAYPFDLDHDGDIDLVMQRRRADGGRELIWFENPGRLNKYFWEKHLISKEVACVESIEFVDIDYDNKTEMITVDDCLEPGLIIYEIPSNPTMKWNKRAVYREKLHGLGIGDLNTDGRADIVSDYQWFENTQDGTWIRHILPSPSEHFNMKMLKYKVRKAHRLFSKLKSSWVYKIKRVIKVLISSYSRNRMNMQILVYDIDGDGDNDIFATQAHSYGAYWLESSGGRYPSFKLHRVLKNPSQLHGVAYADIDNDGDIDVFAGKSRYSHGDPGEGDPLDVFWLELIREGNKVKWIKHPLSASLVMGFGPLVCDIDNDGDVDLLMRGLSFGMPPQFSVTIFKNQSNTL